MPDPIISNSCCAIGAPDGSPVTEVIVTLTIAGGVAGAESTVRFWWRNSTVLGDVSSADTYTDVSVTLDANGEAIVEQAIPAPAEGFKRCKDRVEIFPLGIFDGARSEEFFVDSGVTYIGEPTDTITGLGHLEGERVVILADGAVHPSQVVTDGSVTLEYEATIVHVGLPYDSILQPMRMDSTDQAGMSMAMVKRIREVTLRVMDTLGITYASSVDGEFNEVEFRSTDDPMDGPPPLFTGDKATGGTFAEFSEDATIILKQTQPLPFTLLALIVHMEIVGER